MQIIAHALAGNVNNKMRTGGGAQGRGEAWRIIIVEGLMYIDTYTSSHSWTVRLFKPGHHGSYPSSVLLVYQFTIQILYVVYIGVHKAGSGRWPVRMSLAAISVAWPRVAARSFVTCCSRTPSLMLCSWHLGWWPLLVDLHDLPPSTSPLRTSDSSKQITDHLRILFSQVSV